MTARRNKRLVEFIDNGSLADAGVSRNEHQLRSTAGDDAVESSEEGLNFGCSPVQCFGNQQPVWRVVFAKREFVDAALSFPFSEAAPKITLHAARSLITVFGRLREQLHNDCRNRD